LEQVLGQYVEDAPQVIGSKDQPDPSTSSGQAICSGSLHGSFCHDIAKIPLAFYGAVWMLHHALSSPV